MRNIFWIGTICLLFVVAACTRPEPCDGIGYYHIDDINFSVHHTLAPTGCDSPFFYGERIGPNSIVTFNQLAIKANTELEIDSGDPCGIESIITDTLLQFIIKSDEKYNENFPAGSILNELFFTSWTNGQTGERYCMSLPDFLNSDAFQYLSMPPTALYITVPPDSNRFHTFDFRIEYSNGKIFENQSFSFYITP